MEARDRRVKRLAFRAWRRGVRELDLLLGGFADRFLWGLSDAELSAFEAVLAAPDLAVYAALRGDAPIPPGLDSPLFRRLLAFTRQPPADRG